MPFSAASISENTNTPVASADRLEIGCAHALQVRRLEGGRPRGPGVRCPAGSRAAGPAAGGLAARPVPQALSATVDLVEDPRVVDRRRHRVVTCASAIARIVARSTLPERVFGSRATTVDVLEGRDRADLLAHAVDRAAATIVSSGARLTPALSTTRPTGSWPLSASAAPITAHSATSGWPASTSSMAPVESRWPATLMTSSMRDMIRRSRRRRGSRRRRSGSSRDSASGSRRGTRSSFCHSVGSAPGGSGSRITMLPIVPAATSACLRRRAPARRSPAPARSPSPA